VNHRFKTVEDPRISEMLDVIFKFAAGDLRARGTISKEDSALDAVMAGINILGEELEAYVGENKRAQQEVSESEGLLRTIFDSVQDGIIVAEAQTRRFRMVNTSMCRMLGYNRDELLHLGMEDIHRAANIADAARQFERMAAAETAVAQNLPVKRKDGTIFYTDVTSGPMMVKGVACLVGVFRDITERRQQERALRESEERFKSILENVVEMFFITDGSLNVIYASPRCIEIYGYSSEEMTARPLRWLESIHPEDKGAVERRVADEVCKGTRAVFEYRILRKDGVVRWVRSASNPILRADGKLQRVYGTVTDITEFESLRSSLNEKEVLLKEIHHRVKNNLQIVISLMRLESRAFSEERVRAALKDLETRIRAMALVHEHLYHSSDLAKIGFKNYLKGLCEELFRTYRADSGRIKLEIDAEAVALDIERAIPCGLIINELLTNAIKYAFPGNRKGVLRVAIHNTADDAVEIVISDDGIGLPETLDIRSAKTLGLQLVTTLAENQLKGKVELERASGTRFRVIFGL
jgi:PAS domain S-box-containing protein